MIYSYCFRYAFMVHTTEPLSLRQMEVAADVCDFVSRQEITSSPEIFTYWWGESYPEKWRTIEALLRKSISLSRGDSVWAIAYDPYVEIKCRRRLYVVAFDYKTQTHMFGYYREVRMIK